MRRKDYHLKYKVQVLTNQLGLKLVRAHRKDGPLRNMVSSAEVTMMAGLNLLNVPGTLSAQRP